MADAIGYVMNQSVALTRYMDDGCIEMHHNASERSLGGIALGRKNYQPGLERGRVACSGFVELAGDDQVEWLESGKIPVRPAQRHCRVPGKSGARILALAAARKEFNNIAKGHFWLDCDYRMFTSDFESV